MLFDSVFSKFVDWKLFEIVHKIFTVMRTLMIILMVIMTDTLIKAQTAGIAETKLKTLDGITISSDEILSGENNTILVFWKSTSSKCCDNLESIQSAWTTTLREKGVKLIAICVDCRGSYSHVKPIVKGKNYDFETYIDVNGDFMRSLSVSSFPFTILLDKNQKELCRYSGYCSGSGELICKKIMEHIEK